MPTTTYVVFGLTSLTVGYILAVFFSFSLLIVMRSSKVILSSFVIVNLITAVVFFHGALNALNAPVKVLGSIFILLIIVNFSSLFASLLVKLNEDKFKKLFLRFGRILLAAGIFGVIYKIDFAGYDHFVKSVFLFYEPSHYATVFGVIFIGYLCLCKNAEQFLVLSITVFIAMYLPSVTLLLYVLLFLFCNYRGIAGYLFILIFISMAVIYTVFIDPNLTNYFLSRVMLSEDNNNLSALVYMQGWADAVKSFNETNGLGLGFQMAGQNEPSQIGERIYQIAGMYKNRDGSFIASKLIIEFGVIGLILVAIYTYFLFQYIIRFKNISCVKEKVLSGVFIGYSVEMFVRSNAYFAFGSTLFLISLLSLHALRRAKVRSHTVV